MVYIYKGAEFLDYIFPLLVSLPEFVCFLLISNLKLTKVLFSFLTVCNFGMLISYVGILSLKFVESFWISLFFESVCFLIILVLILEVFRKPYFKILSILEKGWSILCSVPLLLTIIIYILLYYPNSNTGTVENRIIVFLVFTLMFVFYAIIYLNFENISHYYNMKLNREVVLIQTEMQKKEFETIQDKISEIELNRHDLRHHINAISSFLHDNNISEAQNYLKKLDKNLNKTIIEKYCENYVVNVILSSYIKKAKDENINVTSKVDISENIAIDNIELGLIFANAIENAIIACKQIENYIDRKIDITCKNYYNQFYIRICNTYVGEILFEGEQPISKKINHGFGTRSIAAIADACNGIYSFSAEDGIFKTTVILNNEIINYV